MTKQLHNKEDRKNINQKMFYWVGQKLPLGFERVPKNPKELFGQLNTSPISCPSHPASFSCSLSGVSFASPNVLGSTFEATPSGTGFLRVLISYHDWIFGFS